MSKIRRKTSPYPTADSCISIEALLVPGSSAEQDLDDGLNISALGMDENESFTVKFNITVDEELLGSALPARERDAIAEHVRVGIVETGTRPRVREFHSATGSFESSFSVTRVYSFSKYFGSVKVIPVVMRSSDGVEVGHARHEGALLAEGQTAGIHFDSPPPRAGNYLDIKYKSFSQEGMLKPYKHLMYYVDTAGEEARIFVNEDIDGLKFSLTGRPSESGNARRVRDAVFATITAHAWSQLFSRAVELLRRYYEFSGAEPGDGSAMTEGALPQWARDVIEVWAGEFSDSSLLADRVSSFEVELDEKPDEVTRRVEAAIQEMSEVVGAFEGLRPLGKRKST